MTTHSHTEDRPLLSRETRRKTRRAERARRAETAETTPPADAAERAARLAKVRRRRRGWTSALTRRILAINVLVLVIPVLGLLHLGQYRESLIASEIDALRTQARAFALSLGSTAVVTTQSGEERLLPEMTRHLMRVLLGGSRVRARVFSRGGELVADSSVLVGPGGQVQVMELPPPDSGSLIGQGEEIYEDAAHWLPFAKELPEYHESRVQTAGDYPEVRRALAGESAGMARRNPQGGLLLSSAVPVQRYRQVLGALMLSKDGADIEAAVRARRLDILFVFGVALAVTVLLSIYLARTIAHPVHRLAEAADRVRFGQGRKFEIPDFSRRNDEIGDLSQALRHMTDSLWARLDAIEGFAADVAHEIKNPLTSLRSAVETVARVDDPAQQRKLMSIILDDVARLDRLISDISDASRLDAELSRAQTEPVDLVALLDALVSAHNATWAETGPRLRSRAARHPRLVVNGIEDRLGQVLRNLIDNAITFSPPQGAIDLSLHRDGAWVEIAIADEGPGLPESKLAAIFERFYTERPKEEKFGTHSGLGLSISKQIVEAHGGTIRAENRVDAAGKVRGARFVIRLPIDEEARGR